MKPGARIVYPLAITWYFPNSNLIASRLHTHGARQEEELGPRSGRPGSPTTPACGKTRPMSPVMSGRIIARCASAHSLSRTLSLAAAFPAKCSTLSRAISPFSSRPPCCARRTAISGAGKVFSRRQVVAAVVAPTSGIMRSRFPIFSRSSSARCARQELLRSMDEAGNVSFRSTLPDGPPFPHRQVGSSGGGRSARRNSEAISRLADLRRYRRWMQSIYPHARLSLEFAINRWDPDRRGRDFRTASQHLRYRILGR